MTTTSETKYECIIQNSPTSVNHAVYTNILSRKRIIDLAREEIIKTGESLETFARIELVCLDESVLVEDCEYKYEHLLTGDEEFEAALDYFRRDGARFDIKEI